MIHSDYIKITISQNLMKKFLKFVKIN